MKAGRALLFLLLLVWSATGLSARPFKSLFVFPGYASLGSVRYLTDATGVITDTFTYDAFGILIDRRVRTSGGVLAAFANPALETPPPGTVPVGNNYRYTGEQWAQDLGMYYLRARYYKPEIGRFWTMDTFEGNNGHPLSLHKYLYCHANPVNLVDPSGHFVSSSEVLVSTSIGLAATAFLTYHVAAPLYYRAQVNSLKTELKTIQEQTELGKCDEFVKQAADLLKRKSKREGKDWEVIIYRNNPGHPVGDYIVAREGFGRYGDGRTPISENGFHAGIIVTIPGEMMNELVSDNNVLCVPRMAWERNYLLLGRPGGPKGPLYELTLRESADSELGVIKVISLSDLINCNY